MNIEQENALRRIARDCRAEMLAEHERNPKSEHDAINTALLNKYAPKFEQFELPKFSPKRWLSRYVYIIDKEINEGG